MGMGDEVMAVPLGSDDFEDDDSVSDDSVSDDSNHRF